MKKYTIEELRKIIKKFCAYSDSRGNCPVSRNGICFAFNNDPSGKVCSWCIKAVMPEYETYKLSSAERRKKFKKEKEDGTN